jgi:glycine cleavage system H lipoate-binding protein
MESFKYVDMFATKGIEYLLILGFLLILVIFWRFLNKPSKAAIKPAVDKITTSLIDWFRIADNYYYHQGHSWVIPENKNEAKVGLDDFAQKLIGKPSNIVLPEVGSTLKQGEKGWQFKYGSKAIDMISPVNGQVVAVNKEVINSPGLINEDPYQNGWLIKVKNPKLTSDLKNLLSGNLAKFWMQETIEKVGNLLSNNKGLALQDGGQVITGFAKEIADDKWDQLSREFLLTDNL